MGSFSDDFNNSFNNQKSTTMTQAEALALIQEKIAGQGNQVDCGGALAEVLTLALKGSMPIEVTDITAIEGSVLDSLSVGDKVVKVTGKQKHLYLVSYKGEGVGEGICLSYNAAGYGETVSYDYTADGWVYNSTDVKTYGE